MPGTHAVPTEAALDVLIQKLLSLQLPKVWL